MSVPGPIARVVDAALEATIVGGFTKVGYHARRRLYGFADPAVDLAGQVMVITGGSSGIGRATAEGLLKLGAEVHFTSRSQDRADRAAHDLNMHGWPGRAVGYALDTADADGVLGFADTIAGLPRPVDALIANAGALTSDRRTDSRGMELTLSSHLVGHYRLITRLRPRLADGARVLFMSSGGMYTARLEVDELEMSDDDYRGAVAYARAKRAQVELVAYLAPRWAPGVIMHSMHPGWADTAGVASGLPGFGRVMGPLLRTAEQGADTMVWLAATGGGDAAPGRFWLDRRPRRTVYLPKTGTNDAERRRLVDWLDGLVQGDRHPA